MDLPDESDPWSVSEPALHREMRRVLRTDESAVLATIVDVEGSAYRRPGAKMLVADGGDSLGAVTAGCLEGPVVDLAATVQAEGSARTETFDLTDDDEWGLGLGCNGVIDLLLEPLDSSISPALEALADRESTTVVTATESTAPNVAVGDRTVLDADGTRLDAEGRSSLPAGVLDRAEASIEELRTAGTPASIDVGTADGDVRLFVDPIDPAPKLLLFGNQNDVHPVSRLGREVGFEVVVASARGASATAEAFPHAHEVVATHPTELPELTDGLTYAVLMSHNFLDDRLALESLLDTDVPYIGLMGPRKRFDRMRDELADEGTTLTDDQLARLSTPVGLDLGGGEPIQIAMSIVSEALAVHNDKSGGRLRDKEGPIHERASVAADQS
jgi:xanthine dehydrogenase accessory factor